MAAIQYEHPLKTPKNWKPQLPSQRQFNSSFPRTLSFADAVRFLEEEIQRLNPASATVYSNYQTLNNERLRKKIGNDPGIAVQLKFGNGGFLIPCDKWSLTEQNIYAMHLALRALKNLDEWGAVPLENSTFHYRLTGNSGVSEKFSESLPEWMLLLGIGPSASLEDAHAIYRHKVKQCANNQEALLKLNVAMDEAKHNLR